MDKIFSFAEEPENESMMKREIVEVNDTAHVGIEPGSSCQNKVENEFDISNKSFPHTTQSGTQQK